MENKKMEALQNLSHTVSEMSVAAIIFIYVALTVALWGANKIRTKKNMKAMKGVSIVLTAILGMLTAALVFQPTNAVLFIIGGVFVALAVLDGQVHKMGI